MTAFPADDQNIIYRRHCVAAGFTDDDLRLAVRRKEITHLVRGAFLVLAKRTPDEHHRLTVLAAVRLGQLTSAIPSHQSAAAVHRLPMLKPNYRRLHTTIGERSGGGRSTARHSHVGSITADDLVEVDGAVVTSIERTAVDVAVTSPMGFAGALAVFDAALRRGADRDTMTQMLQSTRRGVGHARRALAYADGRAENPGESWSHAQMIEAGLPLPRLQHEFHDDDGRLVARTDFDWAGRLVGEFDGAVKYLEHARPGESPADVVIREKNRENALRALGIMVIRWTWADLEAGRLVPLVRGWLTRLAMIAA